MDYEVEYELSLADRDDYLEQIEAQIKNKKAFLLDKRKTLLKTEKHNEFLKGVNKDYHKYFHYIVDEKKKQMEAMNTLNAHLDKLIVSGHLAENDIKNSKKDQTTILREMNKIKKSLDEIIAEDK